MNNASILWEEKNLTEQKKNYLSNNVREHPDIMNDIKSDLILPPCENIGKEKVLTQKQVISKQYYYKHRAKILARDKLNRDFEKSMCWKKTCPVCNKEIFYNNKHNLYTSIDKNLPCKNCSQKLRPYEWVFKYFIKKCKSRNIMVDITYEDFIKFTKIQTCTYCDEPLIWSKHKKWKSNIKCRYNLDRKDNKIGYNISNCCVCCPDCNSIKSNRFSYDEMLEIGKIIKTIKNKRHE